MRLCCEFLSGSSAEELRKCYADGLLKIALVPAKRCAVPAAMYLDKFHSFFVMRSRRSLFVVRASLLVVHRATGNRNWSACHKFTAAVKTPFQRICSNQPIETYTLILLEHWFGRTTDHYKRHSEKMKKIIN